MSCRTGCITRDCESFAACLRGAGVRVAYSNSAKNLDASTQKKWDADLDYYRSARAEGIQPSTTKRKDVEAAVRASDHHGSAFRADV